MVVHQKNQVEFYPEHESLEHALTLIVSVKNKNIRTPICLRVHTYQVGGDMVP